MDHNKLEKITTAIERHMRVLLCAKRARALVGGAQAAVDLLPVLLPISIKLQTNILQLSINIIPWLLTHQLAIDPIRRP